MKKIILLLLTLSNLTLMVAQNNNILKVRITLKGESQKLLDGVKVIADKANEAYTKNGEVSLICKGKSEGEFVTLTIEKKGYVVINPNALQKVVISKKPDVSFDIEMQQATAFKSDLEKEVSSIKKQMGVQTQLLKDLREQNKASNSNNDPATQQSIQNIGKDITSLRQALDSLKKPAEVNGFTDLVQDISEMKETLEANQIKILNWTEKKDVHDDKTDFKQFSINKEAFNAWNIIKEANVTATSIDNDKVVIKLDINKDYQSKGDLFIKIVWDGKDKLNLTGDGKQSFGLSKTITWYYAKDNIQKEVLLAGNKLSVFVYTMDNIPQTKSKTLEWTSIGVGVGSLLYSSILYKQYSGDYNIYKSETNENIGYYKENGISREDLYTKANNTHSQFLIAATAGTVLTAAGIYFLQQKVKKNRAATAARKNSLLVFSPEQKHFKLEPIIAFNGSLGFGLRLKY